MSATEYAVIIAVGTITICLLVGSFVYLLFTSHWDILETISFAFVPVAFAYYGVRTAVIMWRRRSRRMQTA